MGNGRLDRSASLDLGMLKVFDYHCFILMRFSAHWKKILIF